MSAQHHSPEDQEKMQRFIDEIAQVSQRNWPHGRVSGDDDGETAFAIAVDPRYRIIRIQFSKPMNWLGLEIKSARELAKMLNEKADELERALTPR